MHATHPTSRAARALAIALLAVTLPATASTLTFDEARTAASRDEAALNGEQMATMADAQAAFLKTATRKCTAGARKRDLQPVGLVLQLDAAGKVTQSWVDAETPVTTCLREAATAATFFAPPKAPFLTAIEMSWSP